ncbi:MAG: sulfotransferase, partial [Gammaproteobacteria bacterium]
TLTAKILGCHPELFMPGETHFFDDIYARRGELGEPTDSESRVRIAGRLSDLYGRYYEPPDQDRIERLFAGVDVPAALEACRSYGDVLSWFMELQMREEGKHRWGNNAPRDLFNYAEILEFYPHARLVVCVRDLRAFLLSYKHKWRGVTDPAHRDRVRKLYHPVVTSLLWKSSMRLVPLLRESVPRGHLVVVPYERLVTEPEAMVKEICAAVGLTYVPKMLDIEFHNSSAAPAEKGIFATSIDRWRQELGVEEIAIAQRIAGHELKDLGYELEPVRPNPVRVAGLLASAPTALWRGLQANKDVRGPLLPYLAKRVVSLVRRPAART